jgi:hypothetical protein
MFLPSLPTLLSGLLLSRRGRSMAGRHAGKIALAGLAWKLWKHSRKASAHAPVAEAAPTARRRTRRRAR